MDKTDAIIKRSGNSSKPWCLHFSDGRKECFKSKEQAIKREQQINFFKHRNKSSLKGSAEEAVAMAQLGIFEEYINENEDEILYLVEDEGKIEAYLSLEDGETIERINE